MLTLVAHAGAPPAPHDLWLAWRLDPLLVAGLLLAAWVYRRGRTGGRQRARDTWRARAFSAALVTLGVALLSPLEAMSGALASAHMVQHLLLVLVAAPLLALSAPSSVLLRGLPLALRRTSGRWRRRLGLGGSRLLRHPALVWLLHVVTLWFWHAAVPYDAALAHEPVHVAEHASFLLTAALLWHVLIGARARVAPGFAVLLLFATALQSVFLSLLLTFARAPWYGAYTTTTSAWRLDPLTDQQLAGVLMWVPAGMIYLAAALALLVTWVRASERDDVAVHADGT